LTLLLTPERLIDELVAEIPAGRLGRFFARYEGIENLLVDNAWVQVNVEFRPVEMIGRRQPDMHDLADRHLPESGKLVCAGSICGSIQNFASPACPLTWICIRDSSREKK
jgi:hypothetical protein